MSDFLITILYGFMIGLALSVDAFMISLVYGTTLRKKNEALLTSLIVGLFHFFMPLLGYFMAILVFTQINLSRYVEDKVKFIAFIILIMLGLIMIIKKDDTESKNIYQIINKIIFAFSVSIDSFLAGIAFSTISHINIYLTSLLFLIVSFSCTYIALTIGKKARDIFLNSSIDFYAGLLMMLLACITLFI